jgi:ribosomal protein L12E/L44/L45/RPP1/RPP2
MNWKQKEKKQFKRKKEKDRKEERQKKNLTALFGDKASKRL